MWRSESSASQWKASCRSGKRTQTERTPIVLQVTKVPWRLTPEFGGAIIELRFQGASRGFALR